MASFWQTFRLFLVVFSLYLLGDVLYRWDGFRYYAPFSEFIPSVALVTILWTGIAVFTALLVWLPFKIFEKFVKRKEWGIRIEHFLLFLCACIMGGALLWFCNRLQVPYLARFLRWELNFLLATSIASVFITWLLWDKAERWIGIIQERINPLVFLFGSVICFSTLLVTYHVWLKPGDNAFFNNFIRSNSDNITRPNIILVTFDALTARNMSIYGYKRQTTPFIDKWARAASVFEMAEAESNITTPTTASLMTGKRLWTHQTYHLSGSYNLGKRSKENIAYLLKKNGYRTMAFVVNPHASVDALGIRGSYDIAPIETGFSRSATFFGFIDTFLYQWFGKEIRLYDWIIKRDFVLFKVLRRLSGNTYFTKAPPERAFNRFISVIEDNNAEPFFVWIHLYPPHDPYLPPEPFLGTFDLSSELRSYKSQEELVRKAEKNHYKYKEFPPELRPGIDQLRSRYDEFILYCDKQFENFISRLEKMNILKNSIVLLSSDHGESFEHNYTKHSFNNLYEQVTNIPLIIKDREQTEGRIINNLVEQIDIPATILDLANIPLPSWMEGRSLKPLMHGKKLPWKRIFSMALETQASRGHKITNGNIAVWEGDYKMIHYLSEKRSQLFNLQQDPDEMNNLVDKEPEVSQHLLKIIQDNLLKANERIKKGE